MEETSQVFEVIRQTLQSSNNAISIKELCSIAGVSRSGYYTWLYASPRREEQEKQDRKDFELILKAFKKRGYKKGARSIYMSLIHMDPPVVMNVKKIRRLMKKYKLICPIRKENSYKRMAKALKTSTVADNLLQREFEKYGPRMVLLTDITYLPYKGGVAYLSTVLDAYTKQILAYVVSNSLEIDFVLETVNILIKEHGISLYQETILHSDQGSHYTSYKFIELLRNKNIRQSMSRRGNCWDNAPQESFFGHMKDHIKDKLKKTIDFDQVKVIIDDYMDYYNNDRYQWELAKLSPNEFYKFCTTGVYPINVVNKPKRPIYAKKPEELGKAISTATAPETEVKQNNSDPNQKSSDKS